MGVSDGRTARGAECVSCAPRDQRRRPRRQGAVEIPGAAGRWLDLLRLLDLYGLVQGRGESGCAQEAANRAGTGSLGMGLVLALERADPLQPRLGRSRRETVVGAQEVRLVGRGEAGVD